MSVNHVGETAKPFVHIPEREWGLVYDPLYGSIPVHPRVREALRLPQVQRLRQIRQLSTVSIPFPGATHTRYEHSLGAYHLAHRVFGTLIERYMNAADHGEYAKLLTPCKRLAVELAAILHDIGHGPTGHTFTLFAKRCASTTDYRHERTSAELIRGDDGRPKDIRKFLERLVREERARGQSDAEILSPESIASLVLGDRPECDRALLYLAQIISGPFDVDKMDYLRRDALYTGVRTGECDIWSIIQNIRLHRKDLGDEEVWTACLAPAAAESLEALLHARDLAYRQIYYQRDHRIAQELVISALLELSDERGLSVEELERKTDQELYALLAEGTRFTKEVAHRVWNAELYEHLPFTVSADQDLDENSRKRWATLRSPRFADAYKNHAKRMRDVAADVGMEVACQRIIIDMPRTPLTGVEAFERELFLTESGETRSLLDLCPHLKLIYTEYAVPPRTPLPRREEEHLRQKIPAEDFDAFIAPFLRLPSRSEVRNVLGDEDEAKVAAYLWGKAKPYEAYRNRLSHIMVAVPPEFLKSCVNEINAGVKESGNVDQQIAAVYELRLKPILVAFLNEFVISDEDTRQRLSSRFRSQMASYLLELRGLWSEGERTDRPTGDRRT